MEKKKDDLNNIAVYWNDEYIGEANSFSFTRGTKGSMSALDISGELQLDRK